MFADLGILPSAEAVARHFEGVVNGIVIDDADRALAPRISRRGMAVRVTGSVMRSADDRRRLAEEVIRFATSLAPEGAG
jgi:LPPG:FO 2-phospho-L-lactate transferase